jgi:heme/copper-type cytochrome/quinol oxidase subunit 2
VQIALVVSWQYRARPGASATYTHGSTTLEIIWTAIPSVLLAGARRTRADQGAAAGLTS